MTMPAGNASRHTIKRIIGRDGSQTDAASCGNVTAIMTAAYPGIPRLQIGQCRTLARWTLHMASAPAQSDWQPQSNSQLQRLMKNRQVTVKEIANGSSRSFTAEL